MSVNPTPPTPPPTPPTPPSPPVTCSEWFSGAKLDSRTNLITHPYWGYAEGRILIISVPRTIEPNTFDLYMYNRSDKAPMSKTTGTLNADGTMTIVISGVNRSASWNNSKMQLEVKSVTPGGAPGIWRPLFEKTTSEGKCPSQPASKTFSGWSIAIIVIIIIFIIIFFILWLVAKNKKCPPPSSHHSPSYSHSSSDRSSTSLSPKTFHDVEMSPMRSSRSEMGPPRSEMGPPRSEMGPSYYSYSDLHYPSHSY